LPANVADTLVDGDAVQPGAEAGAELEVFQRAEGADKNFLGDVGGLVVIAQHAQGNAIDPLLVSDHQFVESPLLASQELSDQFMFFGRIHSSQFETPFIGRLKKGYV
jgi:hypothetical protein